MQKSGGGSTRLKQHLAARRSSVLHCGRVPPPVREYFQRDIERTKKATTERARQRVAREDAAAAGNSPVGGYDEEAQIQDAINLLRAEAEFRQLVRDQIDPKDLQTATGDDCISDWARRNVGSSHIGKRLFQSRPKRVTQNVKKARQRHQQNK
jgi:hypothetical protein